MSDLTIELPVLIHGTENDVSARCADFADRVAAGQPLVSSPAEPPHDGQLIVLDGPAVLLSGGVHVHAWCPLRAIRSVLSRHPDKTAITDRIFAEALDHLWGVLGLISVTNQSWLGPPARHEPFLDAVREHADDLLALDGRYTVGQTTGSALAAVPTNIPYAMANLGADKDLLRTTRDTRDLLALLG